MKKWIVLFLLFSIQLHLIGQSLEEYQPFIPNWSEGDTFNYRITRVHESWNEGKLTKIDSVSYLNHFLVIEKTDSIYKIRWRRDDFFPPSVNFELEGKKVECPVRKRHIDLTFTINKLGRFQGIEQEEKVAQEMFGYMTTAIVDYLTQQHPDSKESLEKSANQLQIQKVEGDPEQIVNLTFSPDLEDLFLPIRIVSEGNQAYKVPMPYNNKDTAFISVVTKLNPVNGKNKLVEIQLDYEIDNTLKEHLIRSSLKAKGYREKSANKLLSQIDLELGNTEHAIFDLARGLPVMIEIQQVNGWVGLGISKKDISKTLCELLDKNTNSPINQTHGL